MDKVGHLAERAQRGDPLVEESADHESKRLGIDWHGSSAGLPDETASTSGQTEQNPCDKHETVRIELAKPKQCRRKF